MKLWLVRHARPTILPGICYGACDIAADGKQTQVSAQGLAKVLPQGVRVITSPLLRCTQLAQALQTLRADLHASTDDRLAEMNFGCWEGVRWDAIPKVDFDLWMANFNTCRFGGHESVSEFMQRVAMARAETQAGAAETVWITHAGVARAMTLLAQGLTRVERADQWPKATPEWGQWWEREL